MLPITPWTAQDCNLWEYFLSWRLVEEMNWHVARRTWWTVMIMKKIFVPQRWVSENRQYIFFDQCVLLFLESKGSHSSSKPLGFTHIKSQESYISKMPPKKENRPKRLVRRRIMSTRRSVWRTRTVLPKSKNTSNKCNHNPTPRKKRWG